MMYLGNVNRADFQHVICTLSAVKLNWKLVVGWIPLVQAGEAV